MLGSLYNCASKNTFKDIFILMVGRTPLLLNYHCWCLKYIFLGCSVIQVSSFTTSIHESPTYPIRDHFLHPKSHELFCTGTPIWSWMFLYWDLLLTKHFEIMYNLIYGHVSNCLFIPGETPPNPLLLKKIGTCSTPIQPILTLKIVFLVGPSPHCGPKVSLLVFKNLFVAL